MGREGLHMQMLFLMNRRQRRFERSTTFCCFCSTCATTCGLLGVTTTLPDRRFVLMNLAYLYLEVVCQGR